MCFTACFQCNANRSFFNKVLERNSFMGLDSRRSIYLSIWASGSRDLSIRGYLRRQKVLSVAWPSAHFSNRLLASTPAWVTWFEGKYSASAPQEHSFQVVSTMFSVFPLSSINDYAQLPQVASSPSN